MKKIGILTFSRANNYGALLQAYALKTILIKLGNKVKVINYLSPAMENWHNPNPLYFQSCKQFIKKIILLFFNLYVRHLFKPFMDTYLNGKDTYSKSELPKLCRDYDLFITGSDQVFNSHLTKNDATFFLDFVEDSNKKFSYAASLGANSFDKDQQTSIKKLLHNFCAISLREQASEKFVRTLLPMKKVYTHLDPTLLLSKKDWEDIAKVPYGEKDFIFFYSAANELKVWQFIKKLSNKTNLPVYYSDGSFSVRCIHKNHLFCTPQEWLGYFLKAKYVVTNSFHGLSFSINLQKNFWVALQPSPAKGNIRIENLLHLTGLEDRLINVNADIEYDSIDWNKVQKKLNNEKQKSINFLYELSK